MFGIWAIALWVEMWKRSWTTLIVRQISRFNFEWREMRIDYWWIWDWRKALNNRSFNTPCRFTKDCFAWGANWCMKGIYVVLSKKLSEFQTLANRLILLNAHDVFFLLKYCFSLPNLQHKYCVVLHAAIANFVTALRCFIKIKYSRHSQYQSFGCGLDAGDTANQDRWYQIRLSSQIALPAFLIPLHKHPLHWFPLHLHRSAGIHNQLFTSAVDEWKILSGLNQPPLFSSKHLTCDKPLVEIASEQVLSAAQNQAGIARLTAVAAPYSGDFLQTIPCSAVCTHIDNTTLRIAVAFRLGAPICAPHSCTSGVSVEEFVVHGLSCLQSAGRHLNRIESNQILFQILTLRIIYRWKLPHMFKIRPTGLSATHSSTLKFRHNALNDPIKRWLGTAAISSRLEPSSLSRSDGKRPYGLT